MKTRMRELKRGAVEVIRLLSPDDLEAYCKDDPLLYEKSIVWLESRDKLPFVRVKSVRKAVSRRGPISFGEGGRVVGYSKLTPNAPRDRDTRGYVRRVFYLTSHDLARDESSIPAAAYDPQSLLPGMPGRRICQAGQASGVCP